MDALTLEWSENGQRKSECGGNSQGEGSSTNGSLGHTMRWLGKGT